MAENRRRRLHLLAPDLDGRILVDGAGRLPTTTFELGSDETTVAAVRRLAAERWSRPQPVLELRFDESGSRDEDAADAAAGTDIAALAVLEAGPAGVSADGDRWSSADDRTELPAALRARVEAWRAEWRGEHPPDPLRAPWSRPGWYGRITAWITGRLDELGRPPIGAIEQRRQWSISAILRTETASGRVWAKAVFPGFAHEPRATAFLHRVAPGAVAPVLAVADAEGWLLLDDVGTAVVSERPEADEDAIRRLVDLQRTFLGRTDELAGAGFVRRPFAALAAQLAASLADASLRRWLDLTPDRAAAIVAWIDAAVGEVAGVGLPDTLVHGDFHPENVVVHDGRAVLFDWSDAAVAHPLVDAMTWSTWFDDDAARGERAWDVFLDAWSDVVPVERLRAARPTLVGLTAAYHAVSYAGILLATEPALRDELGDGLAIYGRALDGAVPR